MLDDPVTLMFTRVPKHGKERDWEAAMAMMGKAASEYPGHVGTTVLKPRKGINDAYRVIVNFDSLDNFRRWETSAERERLLHELESLESEPVTFRHESGLETWFEMPEDVGTGHAMIPPPRHKMMVVSGVGVYLTITPLLLFLGPLLQGVPVYILTAIMVLTMSVLLTYVVMPLMTKVFRPWLYCQRSNVDRLAP